VPASIEAARDELVVARPGACPRTTNPSRSNSLRAVTLGNTTNV
jgi:hypothetical protein